jgi:hypothetical protein
MAAVAALLMEEEVVVMMMIMNNRRQSVYEKLSLIGMKHGYDYTVEYINHVLELQMELDQFFDMVRTDK